MFWSARLIQLYDCEEFDIAEPIYLLPGWFNFHGEEKKRRKIKDQRIPAEFYEP